MLTPRLTPSYPGSPFSGAVCSTALQMRGVNPCVCTHRSSLASLTWLIPAGEQSTHCRQSRIKPYSWSSMLTFPWHPFHPVRAPGSAVGSHWALSCLTPPSTSLKDWARRGKILRSWKTNIKCWALISLAFCFVFQLNPLRLSTQSWEILETLNSKRPHFTCCLWL